MIVNNFSFTATFSDYLQGTSTDTYFTATLLQQTTQSVFNLETDTVASYDMVTKSHSQL